MKAPRIISAESDFGALPLADHTYALDSFPTDEVPNVLAFEEVESEQRLPQSFFSIVEEHAYAYRTQHLLDDEWSNLPGITAEPQCVDAGTQTEGCDSVRETADGMDECLKALASVERLVRAASLTAARPLVRALQAAALFLRLPVAVKGPRVRAARAADLFRLLLLAPGFCDAPRRPARRRPGTAPAAPASPAAPDVPPDAPAGPGRASTVQRSGRVASMFRAEARAAGSTGFRCPECGRVLAARASLTRHLASMHSGAGRRFRCDLCPARYKRRDTLLEHRALKHRRPAGHDDDVPTGAPQRYHFRCKRCFKSFKRKALLDDHMNTHTGALSHPCQLCSQKFTARTVLRYHLKFRHGVLASAIR